MKAKKDCMVTTNSSPSLEDWRELYRSALKFKELAPWGWMSDNDLFGVQNPENGDIGYCCVLGGREEFFGLAVYLGTEGLIAYLDIQSGKISAEKDPFKVLLSKKCLVASFENKSYLVKKDLSVIKELGLTFKGRNAFPQFRNYEPGYYPWFLTKDQAVYLTLCLDQAHRVALCFRDEPELLTPQKENVYFVRVPDKEDETVKWTDAWLEPLPWRKIVRVSKKLDSERLQKIATTASGTKMVWEIDTFYVETCVRERDERPFYPITLMCVDRESDFILGMNLVSHKRFEDELLEYFFKIVEEHKVLPKEILVKKEEPLIYLQPVAEFFNIELKSVKRLSAIEKVRKSMLDFFAKGDRYAR